MCVCERVSGELWVGDSGCDWGCSDDAQWPIAIVDVYMCLVDGTLCAYIL